MPIPTRASWSALISILSTLVAAGIYLEVACYPGDKPTDAIVKLCLKGRGSTGPFPYLHGAR